MDVKIGGSHSRSRSLSRSSSPKDALKKEQTTAKSYRTRNHSPSPESKRSRRGRSHSRDKQSSPSKSQGHRRRSGSREHSRKRRSYTPGHDSKHSHDHRRRHSSRERRHSRERRRSHDRKRSLSRERKPSGSRDRRRSPSREHRSSRDKRHSPIRRSSSHDRKRSPNRDRRHSRSRSRDQSKRGHSRSHSKERSRERKLSEKSKTSPSHHSKKRTRSPSPRKTDVKKAKDVLETKPVEGNINEVDKAKPGLLPLNLNMGLVGQTVTPQLVLQQTMAAVSAQAAGITGVALPKYYNPTAVNPLKYAEQMQKRKLLWQGTKEKVEQAPSSNIWEKTRFMEDQDGKVTAKFRKLMGIKGEGSQEGPSETAEKIEEPSPALLKQETLFRDLDQQYEVARISTHTQRGVGLGYSAHPTLIFPK